MNKRLGELYNLGELNETVRAYNGGTRRAKIIASEFCFTWTNKQIIAFFKKHKVTHVYYKQNTHAYGLLKRGTYTLNKLEKFLNN